MKNDQIRVLVTKEFKEKFKKYCEDNDKNMSKVVIRLIEQYLKEQF